jgi:2,5-dioxopentanoate dehydrogenase
MVGENNMITGELIIGQARVRGTEGAIHGISAATGAALDPAFGLANEADVEHACALAGSAYDGYRESSIEQRASFLERIAQRILDLGDELIERAVEESGLPRQRIEGERARTVTQLRLFAEVVREGSWLELRVDEALPDRKPLPRSDIRQRHIALGPVAVFGASNFPLAFSVAGGDTASALAAGCPVIVKAHPAHPGTSELVGNAVRHAVRDCGLPDGVFSLLFASNSVAIRLVTDPRIRAVGFTGSRQGGIALVHAANSRPEPIPVYAEMSSINPVFLLPEALARRSEQIALDFVASLTMGAGQFCTNPGLVLALAGPDAEAFIDKAGAALSNVAGTTMLSAGIHSAYCKGMERLSHNGKVRTVARGKAGTTVCSSEAALFVASASAFLQDPALQEEVFGPCSLVVLCENAAQLKEVAEHVEGQLTATIQMEKADEALARTLLSVLERKVGRILVNGFPTGVEVCHAMVHGGPFPATSDPRSTSVGSLAISRFLRPVCYQDFPASLLPAPLGADIHTLPRRINGKLMLP